VRKVIYLDAAASTPLAPEALEATVEAMKLVGNPGAAHAAGHAAADRVEGARAIVADLAGVGPASVVFTASATEANNLALRGLGTDSVRRGIVTTTAEHPSVLSTMRDLADASHRITYVGVLPSGEVDIEALADAITHDTAVVTVHAANNETGVVQPIEKVVALAREHGALVHADASQLMAWGPSAILEECDLITISSHKMHGPQGAAALIVRPSARAALRAQVTGGGQERGLRSGTSNVAAIAGFGAAARLAIDTGREAGTRVQAMRQDLLAGLIASIGDVIEHSASAGARLPGILNVAIGAATSDIAESEALLARVPSVAASTGSACHAGAPGPSPVLLAMGISEWEANRSVRLSLSRYTSAEDIATAVADLTAGYSDLARLLDRAALQERYA
jgi:cysteine desulfurase